MVVSRHPSLGPKKGGIPILPLHSHGSRTPSTMSKKSILVPNKGKQNQIWLPHPYLLKRPKRGQKWYVTPAFSGIPNAKRGEQKISSGPKQRGTKLGRATSPLPSRGPKRGRKCYVTPAFSGIPNAKRRGPKKLEEVPNKGEQNEMSPPHPCLLRCPKVGGNATSPLPSQWPKRGRKCYVTRGEP